MFDESIIPAAQPNFDEQVSDAKSRAKAAPISCGHKGMSPQEARRMDDIRELKQLVRDIGEDAVRQYLAHLEVSGNGYGLTMEDLK